MIEKLRSIRADKYKGYLAYLWILNYYAIMLFYQQIHEKLFEKVDGLYVDGADFSFLANAVGGVMNSFFFFVEYIVILILVIIISYFFNRFYFNNLRTRILPLLSFAKVVR